MNRYVVVALAFLAVAVPLTAAIKCYECIPDGKKDCAAEEDRTTINCGEDGYCRKMVQEVLGSVQYVFQCGKEPAGKKKPYYNTANDYVKASVYHCDTDLCNAATEVGVSKMAALFSVVAVAWMLQ